MKNTAMVPWFSVEVAVLRRFLKVVALIMFGVFMTACSGSDGLTGPGAPSASVSGSPVRMSAGSSGQSGSSSGRVSGKGGQTKRGTRYAMGAN
jgi:hypothetical protein